MFYLPQRAATAGHFKTRQQNLKTNQATIAKEVERERIAISQANSRIRNLQAQQRLTSSQVSSINREINALNSDVNRLSSTGDPQQAAALRARIKQRKAAINSFANCRCDLNISDPRSSFTRGSFSSRNVFVKIYLAKQPTWFASVLHLLVQWVEAGFRCFYGAVTLISFVDVNIFCELEIL